MAQLTIKSLTNIDVSQSGVSLISNKTFVGIDFGTSTSIVSIISLENADIITRTIPIKQKTKYGTDIIDQIVPTVISIFNNNVLVGKGAEELKFDLKKDKDVYFNFKMDLGEQHEYSSSIFDRIKSPKDATSIFIRFLKAKIEEYCRDNNLPEAIYYSFSIPAAFESNQRREFIQALAENDIKVDQSVLIDEPNAAFVSYLRTRFQSGSPLIIPENTNLKYLVFDFGAGTCDVSIIEVGNTFDGIFSKNLAISKFEKIGGRNIDEIIVRDVLFDQFLVQNNLNPNDFSKVEKEQVIFPRLLKTAENLKIELCQRLAIQFNQKTFDLPDLASSEDSITLQPNVIISTTKGEYKLPISTLKYNQFRNILQPILENTSEGNTIFNPIYDVLSKANITSGDIFAVLFIGGSSKNPYIQNAISEFFDGSEKLVPNDLQTHVSEGTAINSLFINGFNKSILRQITSNTILLDTRDGKIPLVRHGVEIPSDDNVLDTSIITWRNGQDIRLPIFSHNNVLLYDIYLKHPDGIGFSENTLVEVKYKIDINKNLEIKANANGKVVEVQIENPFFSGSSLTPLQRNIRRLERHYQAEKELGLANINTYRDLVTAYKDDEQNLLAAKLMVEAKRVHSNIYNYNDIGLAFSNANDSTEACKYYKKALEEDPKNSTILFNLSYQLNQNDPNKRVLLEESISNNSEHAPSLIEYARLLKYEDSERARKMEKEAFNILNQQYQEGTIPSWGKSWLRSVALATGNIEVFKKINAETQTFNDLFDDRVAVKGDIIKI